jgi:hypothetical protein
VVGEPEEALRPLWGHRLHRAQVNANGCWSGWKGEVSWPSAHQAAIYISPWASSCPSQPGRIFWSQVAWAEQRVRLACPRQAQSRMLHGGPGPDSSRKHLEWLPGVEILTLVAWLPGAKPHDPLLG